MKKHLVDQHGAYWGVDHNPLTGDVFVQMRNAHGEESRLALPPGEARRFAQSILARSEDMERQFPQRNAQAALAA